MRRLSRCCLSKITSYRSSGRMAWRWNLVHLGSTGESLKPANPQGQAHYYSPLSTLGGQEAGMPEFDFSTPSLGYEQYDGRPPWRLGVSLLVALTSPDGPAHGIGTYRGDGRGPGRASLVPGWARTRRSGPDLCTDLCTRRFGTRRDGGDRPRCRRPATIHRARSAPLAPECQGSRSDRAAALALTRRARPGQSGTARTIGH
jgi:hypothetical protein